MKRLVLICLSLFLLSGSGFAQETPKENILEDFVRAVQDAKGKDVKTTVDAVPFTGKLVNYGPSIFVPPNSFTELKNFRYYDNGIGTRGGSTDYTVTALSGASQIISIFPFENDLLSKTVAVISGTTLGYYPIEGGAWGTLITSTSGTTSTPITHAMVRDTLCLGDVGGVTLYSGVSVYPSALLVEYLKGVYTDRYDWIHDGSSHTVAAGTTIHAGYTRAFDDVQLNSAGAALGTASGATEYLKSGKAMFWVSTAAGATVQNPKIVCNARELGASWDGQSWAYPIVAGFHKAGASAFQDYSLFLQDNSEETYMDVSEMESGGTIYFGWLQRPREIHVYLPEEYKNTTAATITVSYWRNGVWTSMTVTDGTASGGAVFAKSGVISIPRITDWETRQISDIPYDVYAISVKVSTTIGNYVRIHKVVALPDYDSPSSVGNYTMVAASHNRLVLANGRDRTKLLISAENQPDCFTGEDSASEDEPIEVGKREDFIWVGAVGAETLIMKQTQNFTLSGVNPSTWEIQPLYGTAPCVSNGSVQVIEKDGTRFVIYAGREGIHTIPSIEGINSDDIKAYWEPGNSLEFSYNDLKTSTSWYDRTYNEYHLIVGSVELVLNLKKRAWSVFDRAYPISCGTYFVDKTNVRRHLGGGSLSGKIYTLESGTDDAGTAIVSDLTRPWMVLGGRMDDKSELRDIALRFHLPDSQGTLTGCTVYLTASTEAAATAGHIGWNFIDNGFDKLNLTGWRSYTKEGFYHKVRMRFPGRINLLQQIMWSRQAPWKYRNGYITHDNVEGEGRIILE